MDDWITKADSFLAKILDSRGGEEAAFCFLYHIDTGRTVKRHTIGVSMPNAKETKIGRMIVTALNDPEPGARLETTWTMTRPV
jgi:hypothetical protein